MGNCQTCYRPLVPKEQRNTKEPNSIHLRQLLVQMSSSKTFESRRLQEFHHDKLPDILLKHYKPKSLHRNKTHYENVQQFVATTESKLDGSDAYGALRSQLIDQNGTFFSLILKTYFRFLETIFLVDKSNQSRPINPRCLFLPATAIKKSKMSSAFKKTSIKYVQELAKSFILVLDMLKVCVLRECWAIVDGLPKEQEYFPQNELIIQRVIQYFVFMRGSIGHNIIHPLVKSLYREVFLQSPDHKPSQGKIELTQTLEKSLIPVACNDNDNSQVYEHSFQKYSELTRRLSSPEQSIIVEEFDQAKTVHVDRRAKSSFTFETNTQDSSSSKIPYYQTLAVLKLMTEETKFWRIWRLIESLDSLVIEVYLHQRDDETMQTMLSHINAEDSKSEILLYVLNVYYQQHPKNLQNLYCMVRFMYDNDSILHERIKFIISPSFIRFHSILGMVINCGDK